MRRRGAGELVGRGASPGRARYPRRVRVANGVRGWFVLLGALALAALCAPLAHASATQESLFMDDNRLLYRGDTVADQTLTELKALGVDRVRVSAPWATLAPGGTAYDNWDHLLRVARQDGIAVLFNVTGPAPHTGVRYPNPAAFGKFIEALGRRYDGNHTDENQGGAGLPRVSAWSIWNEPNQAGHLQPQWRRTKRGRWIAESPRIYRALVRSSRLGLAASGHGGDQILIGETAPIGVNAKGTRRPMRPVPFLAALFCLKPTNLKPLSRRAGRELGCDFAKRGPLRATGFAHHPYSVTAPPDRPDPNPNDIRLADRDRLARVLDTAAAAKRVTAGLPFWWTEFGWQTNPPDPTPRGISLDAQAMYIAQAERMSWADPRAAGLTQFLLRDDGPRDLPASDPAYWSTYQTGLEFADGTHKPSYASYRLPLVASAQVGAGQPLALWGMVRPGAPGQQVHVQFAPEGSTAFADVGAPVTLTDPEGYFETSVAPTASGTWRFTWAPPQATPPKPGLLDGLSGRKPAAPTVYASTAVPVQLAR
jgi:hypothetical protein